MRLAPEFTSNEINNQNINRSLFIAKKGASIMKKRTIIYLYLGILLVTMTLLFAFTCSVGAKDSNTVHLGLPGIFRLVDQDKNLIPDHVAFSVKVSGSYKGERLWLCGELQALIKDEWQTISSDGTV